MKQAILFTCSGLMGAAALAGLIDYSYSSKAGLLEGLYADEEPTVQSTLPPPKDIDPGDYSRAAFEYRDETEPVNAAFTGKKRAAGPPPPPAPVKELPPPPPPPLPEPPPTAPPDSASQPALPPDVIVPVTEPAPTAGEIKEIRRESFSRAPLKKQREGKKKTE